MLRGRCLWGPDFFSWWCWTHLHMNWIKTSLIRPGEHAFLPIALVSNTLPPSAYLRVHCLLFFFFFSFFYTPFPQCSAFTFARLLWGGFFSPSYFFFPGLCSLFVSERARWFSEKAAGLTLWFLPVSCRQQMSMELGADTWECRLCHADLSLFLTAFCLLHYSGLEIFFFFSEH